MLTTMNRHGGVSLECSCIVKRGLGTHAQGNFMRGFPDVFVPVLALDPVREAYAMPFIDGSLSLDSVATGFANLEKLWKLRLGEGFRPTVSIQEYYRYCQGLEAPVDAKVALEDCYHAVRDGRHMGLGVAYVHGDATLENLLPNGKWIDPNLRRVPDLRELDGGKLIQSLMGYHGPIAAPVADATRNFLLTMNPVLLQFFFTSHVVRLCRHQPEKMEWVWRMHETGALAPSACAWENA